MYACMYACRYICAFLLFFENMSTFMCVYAHTYLIQYFKSARVYKRTQMLTCMLLQDGQWHFVSLPAAHVGTQRPAKLR